MAQGYPHIVYGVRTTSPIKEAGHLQPEDLAAKLGLPGTLAVQSPDRENDYEWSDIHPVIYIKASFEGPYSGKWHGSVRARTVDPAWNQLLLDAVKAANLEIDGEPGWFAYAQTY